MGALKTLKEYAQALLKPLPFPTGEATPAVAASSLWTDGPAVIYVVRRPGCGLCRAEAKKLYEIEPELAKLGVKLTAVVHENLPEQIEEFKTGFWPRTPLYLDESKALFRAVGDGTIRKGWLSTFLNPFSSVWANVKAAKEADVMDKANLIGEGTHLGGLLVVQKGGDVVFQFQEKQFGDHADSADVLEAAKKAAANKA